jgi:hypothetical protein
MIAGMLSQGLCSARGTVIYEFSEFDSGCYSADHTGCDRDAADPAVHLFHFVEAEFIHISFHVRYLLVFFQFVQWFSVIKEENPDCLNAAAYSSADRRSDSGAGCGTDHGEKASDVGSGTGASYCSGSGHRPDFLELLIRGAAAVYQFHFVHVQFHHVGIHFRFLLFFILIFLFLFFLPELCFAPYSCIYAEPGQGGSQRTIF